MNRFHAAAGAIIVAMAAPSAVIAAPVYNSAPAVGFHYGVGNDYTPANAAVLTGVSELSLRFHQTGQTAPLSDANGVYSFALGTTPISFDWGITNLAVKAFQPSLITVTNIGTGQTASYDPFFVGNDNYTGIPNTAQNSARINFGFLLGNGFTPNVDSTYRVSLTSGNESLSVDAKLGLGATAVPEPATWAMMIVGVGAIGGATRRSRKTTGSRALA